jgi:hypothetical protein
LASFASSASRPVQVLFVAVLAVMVLGSWPQQGVLEGSVGIAGDAGAGALRGADRFLLGLTLGQIVLLMLFVPGVASVAVSGEREQNTLEMLYASRLRPREIIAERWRSRLGIRCCCSSWRCRSWRC